MTPIDYTQPERRLRELLNEWLKGYFKGTPHSTPTGARTFPDADILFNQAALPDSTKPQIHLVWTAPKLVPRSVGTMTISVPGATTYTGHANEMTGPWDMQVFLRVKDNGDGNRAEHACANFSDNFSELLQSSEVAVLAQYGLTNLHMMSGPVPLQTSGWRVRFYTLRVTPVYYAPKG